MTEPSPATGRARQRGFSLVEAAIVLVIIALILGAVLQGRALIGSAEYKSLKDQVGSYRSAFDTFRDRFNALPGDFADANDRLGLTGANGGGNGVIDDGPSCDASGEESCLAWRHLRAADLLEGDPGVAGTGASPEHPYESVVSGFFTGDHLGNGDFGHKLLILDLPVEVARQLDDDLDDGVCNDGRVSGRSDPGDCSGTDWADVDAVDVVYAL